ncbi:hypothetical protein [Xanthomonas bonasiae]|uniref:hypothetical protein n=1 Tax=Xanthomonas bonasiae TaxID=2810351 RepID=UPI001F13F0FF|nr:hypothetical protein [Xanthomonas bonasiae]
MMRTTDRQGTKMKAWQHDWKVRIVPLLSLCALLSGCASSAFADSAGADARLHEKAASEHACPSQDFTAFLQRYADVADDRVRLRFTADPLEYEVPTHTVEDETASSPPTHVSRQSGRSRLELFPYRYFKSAKAFDRIDPRGDQKARQGAVPYPVAVTVEAEDGRKVAFGMEYEMDTYLFKRSKGCWYLTRAINLRD